MTIQDQDRFLEQSRTIETLSLRCAEVERQKIALQVATRKVWDQLQELSYSWPPRCLDKAKRILEEAWLKV